jgi:CubicO group peptidase (beta-lactamase class C family)
MKRAILAGVLLVCAAAHASQPSGKVARAWAQNSRAFQQELREEGAVGGSLYVLHRGEVVGAEHYGLEDRASGRKVDADTLYHWGSITKTFTAIAIMQLEQRGKLRLDDPVVKYLPELAAVHNPYGSMQAVTIRQLLTHSAGFQDATWPWRGEGDWQPFEPTAWSQIVAMLPYMQLKFEPGSRYSYSNPAFNFLGRIVEVLSGKPIEVYIDHNVFKPLGMTRSYFDITPYFLADDRSHSYIIESDGQLTDNGAEFDTGITTANGGLNAPVSDMVRYVEFLLGVRDTGHYETVLPREKLLGMWEPVFETDFPRESMGTSFFIVSQPAHDGGVRRFVGHTGMQQGFVSFIYIDPASDAAAVMAVNSRKRTGYRDIFFRIRDRLFDTMFSEFSAAVPLTGANGVSKSKKQGPT